VSRRCLLTNKKEQYKIVKDYLITNFAMEDVDRITNVKVKYDDISTYANGEGILRSSRTLRCESMGIKQD